MPQPCGVVAGRDEQRGRAVGSDARPVQQLRGVTGHQVMEPFMQFIGFGLEGQDPAGQQPQRVDDVRWTSLASSPGPAGWRTPGSVTRAPSPASDSRSCGSAPTRMARSWLIALVRALTAESRASLTTRIASTMPSPVLAMAADRPDKPPGPPIRHRWRRSCRACGGWPGRAG